MSRSSRENSSIKCKESGEIGPAPAGGGRLPEATRSPVDSFASIAGRRTRATPAANGANDGTGTRSISAPAQNASVGVMASPPAAKSARACGSRAGTAKSRCSVTAKRTGTVCRAKPAASPGVRWDASQRKGVLELAEIGQLLVAPGERRQQVRGQGAVTCSLPGDRVDPPGRIDALERSLAAVLQILSSGAQHLVDRGAGEDLPTSGRVLEACGDHDGLSVQVPRFGDHLARVQANPQLHRLCRGLLTERHEHALDLLRATDRPTRRLESQEHPVAETLHLDAPVALHGGAAEGVNLAPQHVGLLIAQGLVEPGGLDHIGEEDGDGPSGSWLECVVAMTPAQSRAV